MHPTRLALPVVFLALVATGLAQQAGPDRIHSYLRDRLATAAPTDKLPVYLVLADQLDYDHWFPRIDPMPIDQRRALVVSELRAHAARTQRRVLDALRRCEAEGQASGIVSCWIANFVLCEATPRAVRELAAFDELEEVRFNASWPLDEVEDGAAVTTAPVAPAPASGANQRGGTPSNGVINTNANLAWALGFTGQEVIVLNTDSGINVNHRDLFHRLWINEGEIPGNGIDDDNNGFYDDVHGWNFFNRNPNIDDGGGHGTQTAGVMVGDGVCSGIITGQAPSARVMTGAIGACCPQTGPVNPAGEAAQWVAIEYGILMGAHVQTASHSYKNGFIPPPNYKMHRRVGVSSLAAGLIRTNSISNNGAICNDPTRLARRPFNISAPGNLPPPYLDPAQTLVGRRGGVIGVGAHDVVSNQRVSYSPCGPFSWSLAELLSYNPTYPPANWGAAHSDYPWLQGQQQGLLKPDVTGPTNTTTTRGGGVTCTVAAQSGTSNATPRVAGSMALWKGANMSLKPEDTAMIVHQTAIESGSVEGKENDWGAGRVDALAGLYLALCTHRVDGVSAWAVTRRAGTTVSFEVDTIPRRRTFIALGSNRRRIQTFGGVMGLGRPRRFIHVGGSGPSGDVAVPVQVPVAMAGMSVFSQCFTDDRSGQTGIVLSSNVIETRFVP